VLLLENSWLIQSTGIFLLLIFIIISFNTLTGECGLTFKDGERGLGAYSAIEKHYFDMLGRADPQHVKIFHESGAFLIDRALCGACGHVFKHPEDLLRHLGNKYNAEQEKYVHKEYFWEIVHQFVG